MCIVSGFIKLFVQLKVNDSKNVVMRSYVLSFVLLNDLHIS